MSNHLEQLTTEWPEHRGYFVRQAILVGARPGGFEGELDVVGWQPVSGHLVHIECSLDCDPWPKRAARFERKFECGRHYIPSPFAGIKVPDPGQIALLQNGGGSRTSLAGARLVWVTDFVDEMLNYLSALGPNRRAIQSTYRCSKPCC